MTTLERMRIPSRAGNAPLHDWDELAQEDHFATALLDRNGAVLSPGLLAREIGQLVIMRGKESSGPNPIVQVLRHCPGDGEAVKG